MSGPLRLLITPPEASRAWAELELPRGSEIEALHTHGQVLDSERLGALLANVDAAILGVERVDWHVLARATALKAISRFGVGVDAIELEALRDRGIRLMNTPGCMTEAVARQALAFILAVSYRFHRHDRALKRGVWQRASNASVGETSVGVVGLGRVGREVVRLLRAIGFRIATFSASSCLPDVPAVASLDELIRDSDIITLHLPMREDTRHVMGGERIAGLTGRSLVNTARGALVDEVALLAGLRAGQIECYATDVFEQEPVVGVSAELAAHDRVIATPHVGAMDAATARAMMARARDNVINCLAGRHANVDSYVV